MAPLDGSEPSLRCVRCGKTVYPRVGGYWFLLLAPRGRCRIPGSTAAEAVLCLGCGMPLREYLEEGAYASTPAYVVDEKGRVRL